MATPFDALLERVTRRLQVDPELRLEVAHELRTHLEDSAAELRAAGRSEADAIAEATRALGGEAELSEQLWRANCGRVRMRKAARWAIGATLIPAAVALSVSAIWAITLSLGMMFSVLNYGAPADSGGIGLIAHAAQSEILDRLPQEKRRLADNEGGLAARAERAKAIAGENPTDPIVHANLALAELATACQPPTAADVDRIIPLLDQGETLEPGNALYPLLKSALLFEVATQALEESDKSAPRFSYDTPDGKREEFIAPQFKILDQRKYDQAIAAFHSAAGKLYLDSHTIEMARRRLDVLPSDTLNSQFLRLSLLSTTLLPHVQHYDAPFERMGSIAIASAARGDRAAAVRSIDAERLIARMVIERSDFIVGMMRGAQLKRMTFGQAALVEEKLGNVSAANTAKQRMVAHDDLILASRINPTLDAHNPKSESLTDRFMLTASTDFRKVDLAPHRQAEYALFDQLTAAVCLGLFVFAAAAQAVVVAINTIRRRDRLSLLFIGWRPLFKVIALSVILPAALFALYTQSPFSGRGYGVTTIGGAMLVEYGLIGIVIVSLLRILTDRAIRERAEELGMDSSHAPAKPSRIWRILAIALAAAAFAYIVAERIHVQMSHDDTGSLSASQAIAIGLTSIIFLFELYTLIVGTGWPARSSTSDSADSNHQPALPQVSWRLGILPVALGATVVVALTCLPLFRWQERRAVSRFDKPAPFIANEIERTNYGDLYGKLLADLPSARSNGS